jgi:hypothetical protein
MLCSIVNNMIPIIASKNSIAIWTDEKYPVPKTQNSPNIEWRIVIKLD